MPQTQDQKSHFPDTLPQSARLARAWELIARSYAARHQSRQLSLLLAIEAFAATEPSDPSRLAAEQLLRDGLATLGGRGLNMLVDLPGQIAVSPDGRYLATSSGDQAHVLDLSNADPADRPLVLRGHGYWPCGLTFNAGGTQLFTSCKDGVVRVWDLSAPDIATTPIMIRPINGGYTIALSPNQHYLATGGWRNTAQLWDLNAMDLFADPITLHSFDDSGVLEALAFSPDGSRLAGANERGMIFIWELATGRQLGEPICLSGLDGRIGTLAFSPDGTRLAAGSDRRAIIWDLTAASLAETSAVLAETTEQVYSPPPMLAFSPDGRYLAVGIGGRTVRLWTVDHELSASNALTLHDAASPLVFSPDSRRLLTGSTRPRMHLWDLTVADPSSEPVVLGDAAGPAAFSPDSSRLFTGTPDGIARMWALHSIPAATPLLLPDVGGPVAVDSHGRQLATVSELRDIRVWDLAPDGGAINPTTLCGHAHRILEMSWSPDGRRLVSRARDGTARVWDLAAADPSASQIVLPDYTGFLAFSPDGKQLISGSGENSAWIWDLTAADPQASPIILRGSGDPLALSPDGRYLITGASGNAPTVWDISLAQPGVAPNVWPELQKIKFFISSRWVFSPDRRYLVTQRLDQDMQLWSLPSSNTARASVILSNVARHEVIVEAVFSSNEGYLATAFNTGDIHVWRLAGDIDAAAPIVLRDVGNTIALSPDATHLATGTWNGLVLLWDLSIPGGTSEPIVLSGHKQQIKSLAFSPDSTWLFSSSEDMTVRIWRAKAHDLAALAGQTAGRNLSWAEWQQFFGHEQYRQTCQDAPLHPSVITHMLDLACDLARQGQIEEALAAFHHAQQRDPLFVVEAEYWHRLCRYGSLWAQAAIALEAGERAVSQAPWNGRHQDSRGVARALAGNLTGAIDDFSAYLVWAHQHGEPDRELTRRRDWIAALQSGRNPFDQATLEALQSW